MAQMGQRSLRFKSQQQEVELIDFIKKRLPELERDNRERIQADRKSDNDYRLQKQARATPGSLFEQSNFPVPLTSWVVDHFSARTEDELLGRDPCMRFLPQGPSDDDIARGIDRCATYKFFEQGKEKSKLQKAIYPTFAHRAAILKATYRESFNEWEEPGLEILFDAQTNAPVEILDHGFIIRGLDTFTPVADMMTGEEREQLDADPTFYLDPARHYYAPAPGPIRFKEKLFSAPETVLVDSDRFLAPADARSLDEADCIVETYDKPMWWALDRFCDRPWLNVETYRQQLASETAEKKTKGKRSELTSENLRFDQQNKLIGIHELWIERDVLGWGRPQKIVVWYDRKREVLIDYEFRVKVTPQGAQPFTAIAIWQQDDVWWGYSIPEMLAPIQEYLDTQFNRHTHRNAINSNPIVGEHPEAVKGNFSFRDLKPFDVVELAENKTIRDWIETFVFPNADQDTQVLIDKAIYWVNFWLGISNIARGDYSDVPQNTTLGGQEATLKEAGKLSRRWTRRVIEGFQRHMTLMVRILLTTMDEEEAYTFLEGEVRQMAFLFLAAASVAAAPGSPAVRDLLVDAKLVWNSEQNSRTIEINQLTLQIVEKYANYIITAPWIIPMVRPILKSSLFMLGHDNVDQMLPLPPGIPPMPLALPTPIPGTVATEAGTDSPEGTAPLPDGVVPFPGGAQPLAAPAMPMETPYAAPQPGMPMMEREADHG